MCHRQHQGKGLFKSLFVERPGSIVFVVEVDDGQFLGVVGAVYPDGVALLVYERVGGQVCGFEF